MRAAQNAAIERVGEQFLHDARARFEIVERFEQRNDIEVGLQAAAARFHQSRLPRQQQHVPHVGRAGRHAQDVAMRRPFAVAHLDGAEGAKFLQHARVAPEKDGATAGLKKHLLDRRDARFARVRWAACALRKISSAAARVAREWVRKSRLAP